MLNVTFFIFMLCHCAECRYAECRYAECCYAECRHSECRHAECRGAYWIFLGSKVVEHSTDNPKVKAGNTKGESITVPLTYCLTGLDESVLQIKTNIVSCHTADSKPVKQEVNSTVILPPLVFPGQGFEHGK
jgi:hypothetical protein